MTRRPRVELLAPAGDERALRAALAAGADAVYFGLERWSARAFAGNFAGDEAARAVERAHLYGAGAHLALNTLLKDDELEAALAALEAPYLAGLDALIVTDLGFAALVRERYPDLELHASTQLNAHSSAQLGALARLGFRRAILARELSIDEISALDAHGLDLEVFVHGALCYGYSGDCLLSSMVGGRSGNRGRCSQSCRMRYRLSADDVAADDDHTRVLSTGDLCAIDALPRLLAAGATSFKIEGRMKDAAYVAVTTAVYREAVDAALDEGDDYRVRPRWTERLEQSFSRGFTTAHLDGRHDEVRSGGRGGHRGVLVGRVASVDEGRGEAVVRLTKAVAEGDVVYLYTPWGQSDPVRVEAAETERLTLRVRERVAVKDRLFRLSAAETGELAHELTSGRRAARPVGLEARLEGRAGEPARLVLRVHPDGPAAETVSSRPLAPSRTVALDEARVRDAVGALGGTPYALTALDLELDGALFLAVGDLKDMRRRAVADLDELRLAVRRRSSPDSPAAQAPARGPAPPAESQPGEGAGRAATDGVHAPSACGSRPRGARDVVLRLRPAEAPLIGPDVEALCLDLVVDDPVSSIAAALARLVRTGLPVRCRLPEIMFDADREWLAGVMGLPWAVVYARHLALPASAPAAPLAFEYPLQGLNCVTPAVLARLGAAAPAAVVVSPEAALDEIVALSAGLTRLDPPPAVEALAFGREQVLRARDRLGRAEGLVPPGGPPGPAGRIDLRLEDAKGYVFPAEVDGGGTRLFNPRVTNLAGSLDELRAAGVSRFLVVQRDLSPDEGRACAAGGLPALAAFVSRERTTTGHLFRGVA
jgi:putative protease